MTMIDLSIMVLLKRRNGLAKQVAQYKIKTGKISSD
jgi:chorismate mutase